MTTNDSTTPTRVARPRLWLAVTAVLAIIAVAVLWPLQYVGQVCVMIYPAPPGCGAEEPRWVPFVAIGLVIAALVAAIVAFAVASRPRRVIVGAIIAIVVVTIAAAAVVALSQTGIWDPAQPLVLTE